MRRFSAWLAWSTAAAAVVVGCAVGEEGGAVFPAGKAGNSGADGGSTGGKAGAAGHAGGSAAGTGGELDDGGQGGQGGDDGGELDGSGAAGVGGYGGSSGQGGSSGTGGWGGSGGTGGAAGTAGAGGTGTPCTSTNTCMGAKALGSLNADTGGSLQGSGYTSQWLQLRAKEDSSSPMGEQMKLKLTLTVPQGLNFDLYVYMNADKDTVECSKLQDFSLNQGSTQESIQFSWGESGTFSNNDDDSRTVSIEIRHMSGTCSATSKWSLTATGG